MHRFHLNYGGPTFYYGDSTLEVIEGLDPEIPIREMLQILKAQEKYLALGQIQKYWEHVRPARSRYSDGNLNLDGGSYRARNSPLK